MIVVIDTNIFLAALLNPTGAPAKLRRRWRQRQFEILISGDILAEYVDVFMHAPGVAPTDAQLLMVELAAFSQCVTIGGSLQACKDPDDDKFLETAVTGAADFLVTKNLKHFPHKSYKGVRIVNVSTFLMELEKNFPPDS